MALAESCTGGLIGKRLTDLPGASDVFPGGIIAYADEVKTRALGVGEDVLVSDGAVAGSVAAQMARGAAGSFGAGAGIGDLNQGVGNDFRQHEPKKRRA